MGRVISYGEKTGYNDGDYLLLDNGNGGTKRIRADRVGVQLDTTLTDPNKAAPAKVVRDRLENVNGYFLGLNKTFFHTGNEAWDDFPCLLLKDISYKVRNNNTDHVLPLRLK